MSARWAAGLYSARKGHYAAALRHALFPALKELNDQECVQPALREQKGTSSLSPVLYAQRISEVTSSLKQAKNDIRDPRAPGRALNQHAIVTILEALHCRMIQ